MAKLPPTRRAAILSFTVTSAGIALSGCRTPDDDDTASDDDDDAIVCEITGAQTEGPFYPGEPVTRVDVRGGRNGLELRLDLRVVDVETGCVPIADAEVDVWHADAAGDYSGYDDFGTAGQDWLRGQQITDAQGRVGFTSIFPGSYPGRSVHVHVKVRADGYEELTTQIYFPDALSGEVLARADYTGADLTAVADDDFYSAETMTAATGGPTTAVTASIVLGLS